HGGVADSAADRPGPPQPNQAELRQTHLPSDGSAGARRCGKGPGIETTAAFLTLDRHRTLHVPWGFTATRRGAAGGRDEVRVGPQGGQPRPQRRELLTQHPRRAALDGLDQLVDTEL